MLICFVYTFSCPCGVDTAGVTVRQCRINKGSIKSTDEHGLGFFPACCKECKAKLPGTAVMSLAEDDLEKVNAYRAGKGWAPLGSAVVSGGIEVIHQDAPNVGPEASW